MSSQDFRDWESASQIDPLMLRLLQKKSSQSATVPQEEHFVKQRQLGGLYAIFVGVSAMLMVLLLGMIRGIEVDTVLVTSCRTLLMFGVIGFLAGKIAEMCVRDSAKSMIREMLQRADTAQNEDMSNVS